MSIDRSLRLKSSLVRHRNVLSRAERIALLKDTGRWSEESRILGLPKVAHRRAKAGKKVKKEAAEGAAAPGVEGAPAVAAPKPGAGKPAAK
jgi:small basic protein (TIGR04137 family)